MPRAYANGACRLTRRGDFCPEAELVLWFLSNQNGTKIKRKKFSVEQIVAVLKQAELVRPVKNLIRDCIIFNFYRGQHWLPDWAICGGKDKAAKFMGIKGGAAGATTMAPEQRSQIARQAVAKRWGKPS